VGILYVTRNNQDAPWLLFEAGALCKGIPKNRVCLFLVDLQQFELKPPLGQFNGTLPTMEDVLKLVKTINAARGKQALSEQPLKKAFDLWWPKFEEPLKEILANYKPKKQVPKRPTEEMVEEILELSRSIQRSLQQEQTRRFSFEPEMIPTWKQLVDSAKQSREPLPQSFEEAYQNIMREKKAETPESETE
jgi:hypothetical protein